MRIVIGIALVLVMCVCLYSIIRYEIEESRNRRTPE